MNQECSVETCHRTDIKALGLCMPHYKRFNKDGDVRADEPIIRRKQHGRGGICPVDDCTEPVRRFGVCNTHSSRIFSHGDTFPDIPINKRVEREPICVVDGCLRDSRRWGFCALHSQRIVNNGDPGEPESRKVYGSFDRTCENCDIQFEVPFCHRDARFCSLECYRTSGMRVSSQEYRVADELDKRGIRYQPQCYLAPYYPDFIVGNTIIEVDGDYWHNLPGIPEKDARKNAFYISQGFDVIRIWEHEVNAGNFSKLDTLFAAKDDLCLQLVSA